ncbi:MAG: hypothetical protein AAF492_08755, partial [Verrucomicrobiota bacterium]
MIDGVYDTVYEVVTRSGFRRGIRRGFVLCALLLSGCSSELHPVSRERVWVVPAPEPELTLTVMGRVGHDDSETVKAPVSELRLAWLASEGSIVEPGDVVARYDTELLDLWLQSNREDLAILERRVRAANIANERSLYNLRIRLLESEADHKAASLAYELSKDIDQSERGILEREVELAQETLAEARNKLDAIKEMQSLGGAAAAEVREAMAAYERALANVRIPKVNLEVFDDADGRRTRMQLDQTLAKLGLAIGPETQPGSIRNRITLFLAQQERDLQWVKFESVRLTEEGEDAIKVIDHAFERSDVGGVIDPHHRSQSVPLVPGAELGTREIVSVISEEDTEIEIWIPEALREAARLTGARGYRVDVRVPSVGPEWLGGALQSVSVVKRNKSGGESTYRGVVKLDNPPAGLNLGASVECRIRLPVPSDAVVIPRWWATRAFRPLVRMNDGEGRRLHAQVVGDWLLVSRGLKPGDRILPPEAESDRNLVLFSSVEPPEQEEVSMGRIRSWEWEAEELVEDGSLVEEGQVIARVRRSYARDTRENSAEIERLKAEASRELHRLMANGRLGTAYMDWQEARLDAEIARVDYEIDRMVNESGNRVEGEVGARLASIQRKNVEEEFERRLAPAYQEIRSANQQARDRLEADVAKLDERKAGLSAASSYHNRDRTASWGARQTWRRLAAIETTFEQAWKRAQTSHRRLLT